MSFQDCIEMVKALAAKSGRRIDDIGVWRPLINFAQGNSLTLTVVVREALRERLTTQTQVEGLVSKLRAGESAFTDDVTEGRSRSLAASLAYGFENAFTVAERKLLALLYFFQGFVQVGILQVMGSIDAPWALRELTGVTEETWVDLLNRAQDSGLVRSLGNRCYAPHPALPWFLQRQVSEFHSDAPTSPSHAFAGAMAWLAEYHSNRFDQGQSNAIGALLDEEANLLQALKISRSNSWPTLTIAYLRGLKKAYEQTGRTVIWSRLVKEIFLEFVDPDTGLPLVGKENSWARITQFRIEIAKRERDWRLSQHLLNRKIESGRENSRLFIETDAGEWTDPNRKIARDLALDLHLQGEVRREQHLVECRDDYVESLTLANKLDYSELEASCYLNLGIAYKDIPAIRDLAVAENCSFKSLGLRKAEDQAGRARSLGQLGTVARQKFVDAKNRGCSTVECDAYLSEAEWYFQRVAELLPVNSFAEQATTRAQIGNLQTERGATDQAIASYREVVRYFDEVGDFINAANNRRNAATALARAGRFPDALEWAKTALQDYERCPNADQQIIAMLKLLEEIESDLQANSPQS